MGFITSYEDIRYGKIRNKWVVMAIIYAFAIYSALILLFLSKGGVKSGYLIELGTNLLFSIFVGFGLWYLNVWTAGDGKLFIAYSMLIPLSSYSMGYQKWIPSFVLMMNIFFPSLLFVIILVLVRARWSVLKKVSTTFFLDFFRFKRLWNSIVSLFSIYWITQILLSLIGLRESYIINITITFAIIMSVEKRFKDKSIYFMLAISVIRAVFDKSIYSLSFLFDFLILVFLWRLIRSFLQGSLSKLGREVFTRKVRVNQLKTGMVLSDAIVKKEDPVEIENLRKQNIKIIKHKGDFYVKLPKSHISTNNFIEEEAEGLTRQQITLIKEMGIKRIRISQTMPFAPFIFLGVILTIMAKGNILIVIRTLF